nr:hypothetical protein B0A51_14730 [Rachicladosporium sp. CCFEE 5018]
MEDKQSQFPLPGPDSQSGGQPQQVPRVQAFQEAFIAAPPLQDRHDDALFAEPRRTAGRSRASSSAKPIIHQPQPIRDAVDQAFETNKQTLSGQLSEAFIAQVTAQVTEAVVRNLQNANLAQQSSPPSQQAAIPPAPTVALVPTSPVQSSTGSFSSRFTPPSPQAARQDADSFASVSPEPVSEAGSTYSVRSDDGKESDRDSDTPRPPAADRAPLRQTEPRRRRSHERVERPSRRRDSLSDSTGTQSTYRRDSQDSATSSSRGEGLRPRVRPAAAMAPLEEPTTLEKIWKPLFDNGNPTVRLGQFLRGLAIHLIDDCEPKGSFVVTPEKMLRFFDETKLPVEVYPWQTIFGGAMSNEAISVVYRKLLCQHHLVQVQTHEAPSVPGLTPCGFEWFLTCLIQAHPSLEFDRLAKAVMNMPISNADDKSERFPKELSRRLLPSLPNSLAEQRIIASMAHEAALLQLRNASAMPPPPTAAPPRQQSSIPERERKPYSRSSFSNAIDDDDLLASSSSSLPVERERKPYAGREGAGKVYDSDSSERYERPTTSQYRPVEPGAPLPRPLRQNSIPPLSSSYTSAGPPPSGPPRHRMSTGSGVPPPSFQPSSYPRPRRSPPPTNPYTRSEPVHVNDIPSAQHGSNMPYSRNPPARSSYLDRDSINTDYPRGSYDDRDEPRGKPIPSRNQPPPQQSAYDPAASSSSRSRPPMSSYDDRRRSTYNPPPPPPIGSGSGGGGTDGYGFYPPSNSYAPPPPPPSTFGTSSTQTSGYSSTGSAGQF